MDLRKRITEEITEVKYNQFIQYCSSILTKRYEKFSDDPEGIESSIKKYSKQFGFTWTDDELLSKAYASFMLSPTLNFKDSDFVLNPKRRDYDVVVDVTWNGYGTDNYSGTLSGYSEEDIKRLINEESAYNELELDDRTFRDYETNDVVIEEISLQNTPNDQLTESKKSNDEFSMYEDYYKNLSPDSFSIKRKGDEIIIKLKK
tara:strand:- start:2596 stop:3204 length:609 start_codon:yes stop_codon:yes gene_type:complete